MGGSTFVGTQMVLSEVECDEVEDGNISETPMKGFAIKASMSEMVLLVEGVGIIEKRKHRNDVWCFEYEYSMGGEQGLKLKE